MFINEIELRNIGLFKSAHLDFNLENHENKLPVIIITGENGAGKSVIIDAIRSILLGIYSNKLDRNIVMNRKDFLIRVNLTIDDTTKIISSIKINTKDGALEVNESNLGIHIYYEFRLKPKWILDYWTSKLSTDSFKISNISKLDPKTYLKQSLFGQQKNTDVTKLLAFLDYLRGSEDLKENQLGTKLFEIAVDIINSCLNNAKFSHISRSSLEPIIKVGGIEISFEKLSSGNLYLIQRLLSLLYQAYSVFILNEERQIDDILNVKGLLLIDEIENHLHPNWQKSIISIIKKFFPNVQIVLTTHSPFIVSSYYPSKVFVCKQKDAESFVVDESEYYTNRPIEEILRTPLFDTDSFNNAISSLLNERKIALEKHDKETARKIEEELMKINPQYFSYFDIDKLLNNLEKDEKSE